MLRERRGEEKREGKGRGEEGKEGDRREEERRGKERRGVRAPQLAAGSRLKLFLLTANQLCNGSQGGYGQPRSAEEHR